METWRCGHPRTPWNTHGGTKRTHAQCRTCRLASQRRANLRYDHSRKGYERRSRYEATVKGLLRHSQYRIRRYFREEGR